MSKPVRLHRQEDSPFLNKVDEWAISHAHIILPLCFIVLMALFIMLCYALVGVSATDSGVQYNSLEKII